MASRKVDRAQLHVHATFNNTIITLTDQQGMVLAWKSPGVVGFKGSRKGTPFAAQMAMERLLDQMKEFGVRSVTVMTKGTGAGRNSVVNVLKNAGVRIEEVKNVTPVSHS
jgi:small subunit ribosomal protein S11